MSELILSAAEVLRLEKRAFREGVDQGALMDLAGLAIGSLILKSEPVPGSCLLYLGKGNNAGDAIIVASVLRHHGWSVSVRSIGSPGDLSGLAARQWHHHGTSFRILERVNDYEPRQPFVLIDGLLGTGARPGLADAYRHFTREMNSLRSEFNGRTYAIDLPSGVSDDFIDEDAVVADQTVAIGFPKLGFFQDYAPAYVGRIRIVDLDPLTQRKPDDPWRPRLATRKSIGYLLRRRHFDAHKGDFGRIGVVAGSRGFIGAAILCSRAAVRAGAGLVTLYTTEDAYPIMAAKTDPEVMVKSVKSYVELLDERLDAIALGPGLGRERAPEVLRVIQEFPKSMVVDADGLNILAQQTFTVSGPRLFTPHPGEMARLWPTAGQSRVATVRQFTLRHPVALLLKGSSTIVGERGQPLSFNAPGTPGMATGGSGDVLTGVCGGLLGAGLTPYEAGCVGAWLCGRSAELALEIESEESLLPEVTLQFLGRAMKELKGRGLSSR